MDTYEGPIRCECVNCGHTWTQEDDGFDPQCEMCDSDDVTVGVD